MLMTISCNEGLPSSSDTFELFRETRPFDNVLIDVPNGEISVFMTGNILPSNLSTGLLLKLCSNLSRISSVV